MRRLESASENDTLVLLWTERLSATPNIVILKYQLKRSDRASKQHRPPPASSLRGSATHKKVPKRRTNRHFGTESLLRGTTRFMQPKHTTSLYYLTRSTWLLTTISTTRLRNVPYCTLPSCRCSQSVTSASCQVSRTEFPSQPFTI